MAKAGSCKIGFSPKPSIGTGKIWLKGFEVFSKKMKKPIIIICWNNKVKILYCLDWFLDFNKNINMNKVNTNNQSNKLPSWFPQVPEIL